MYIYIYILIYIYNIYIHTKHPNSPKKVAQKCFQDGIADVPPIISGCLQLCGILLAGYIPAVNVTHAEKSEISSGNQTWLAGKCLISALSGL